MRASQRPGASSSLGVGSIASLVPEPVQALEPGAFDHAVDERLPLLVVRALELEPEQALDEALGLAPLDAVALHRLVDLVERGDEAAPDPARARGRRSPRSPT